MEQAENFFDIYESVEKIIQQMLTHALLLVCRLQSNMKILIENKVKKYV